MLRHDVQQVIQSVGLDCREHGIVDRRRRARMAVREGEQVAIVFLGLCHAALQLRHRSGLKVYHRPHGSGF
ncbi:hypothetical protein H6P80_11560 [Parasphingopyxis sp. GrpM-11]|uniref:Uncharacterized protein n=1 Tax=Parasphingopyxis marina TaxID=2761622 RepID=A0A842I2Z2_9SPHN|nr:hypothetical protein [Parasphingopyxis marina]